MTNSSRARRLDLRARLRNKSENELNKIWIYNNKKMNLYFKEKYKFI